MKYYAVLDTNVIVSAMLKKGSVPNQVMVKTYVVTPREMLDIIHN